MQAMSLTAGAAEEQNEVKELQEQFKACQFLLRDLNYQIDDLKQVGKSIHSHISRARPVAC